MLVHLPNLVPFALSHRPGHFIHIFLHSSLLPGVSSSNYNARAPLPIEKNQASHARQRLASRLERRKRWNPSAFWCGKTSQFDRVTTNTFSEFASVRLEGWRVVCRNKFPVQEISSYIRPHCEPGRNPERYKIKG